MKKSSIILSLLTLTLALATLPALGDLNYLKENYNYLEKIPVVISSSINNTNRTTDKLLDNKKNTEWISWKENVIWAEDYSQNRYFTQTVIDGTNDTKSTINNNTLSLSTSNANWRQFHVLSNTASDELESIKAGVYKFTMRYRGDIAADGGNVFLGRVHGDSDGNLKTEYQMSMGTIPTEWTENTFEFKIDDDINNAFCSIQPGGYKGTLEVDWAELKYEGTGEDTFEPPLIDYSTFKTDSFPYYVMGYTPIFEDGVLIAQNNEWYQFRIGEGMRIRPNVNYQVRLRIKGSSSGQLTLHYISDDLSLKKFSIPTTDEEEMIIPLGNFGNSEYKNVAFTIQSRDGYSGRIEIKRFILEYEENGNWIAEEENVVNYQDLQNWPYKGKNDSGVEYIPALVSENGRTVARITNPQYNETLAYDGSKKTYQFQLANNLSLSPDTYTVRFKIKSDSEGSINMVFGGSAYQAQNNIQLSNTGDEYQDLEINNLSLSGGNGNFWIVCRPSGEYGNYQGNFSIESIEFISETPKEKLWSIKNEGTIVYAGDAGQYETKTITEDGEDISIICSYPLPQTRKVLLAMGDAVHAYQQYNGKSGFALRNNGKYTISFKIKGSEVGTAKLALADATNHTLIGESSEFDFGASDYEEIWTTVTASQAAGSGSLALDLGYYLGSIYIQDLKIYDNYDETIGYHQSTSQPIASQTLNAESSDNFRTTQFFAAKESINFDNKKKYGLNVVLNGDKAGLLCAKLGGYYYNSNRYMHYLPFGDGTWQQLNFDTSGEYRNNFNGSVQNGNITLQFCETNEGNYYDGTVDVKTIRLISYSGSNWEDWTDGNDIPWDIPNKNSYDYYNFDGAISGEIRQEESEKYLSVKHNQNYYQFYVMDGVVTQKFERGRLYKLRGQVRAPEGNVNSITASIGTWGSFQSGVITTVNSTWTDFEVLLGPCMTDRSGVLLFQPNGNGPVEMKNIRLVPNANETIEFFADYTGANHSMAIPTGILMGSQSKSYDAVNEYDVTNGLHLEPQCNELVVMDNLRFDIGQSYEAKFNINVSHPGEYIITLGNNQDSQSDVITVESEETGGVEKTVNFNTLAAETGSLTVTPKIYTQTLSVSKATLNTVTPEYDGSSIIGADFFQVDLGEKNVADQDGKYLFHIGYAQQKDGTPRESTPKKFVIMGCAQPYGAYKRLGTYDVEEMADGNGFVNAIANPLNINTGDNIRYLRFVCTDNEGPSTGICLPKKEDGSGEDDGDHAYTGSMIRMTRFGVYKESKMFATDNGQWALPLLTRFQIEALGQKYAYPGPTLEDMVGVGKSIEIGGQLFDNDPYHDAADCRKIHRTYWDTTLPFLKDTNLGTDKFQYLDYEKFTYPEEYDGNTNYDCIDLLFPDLSKLGALKKTNGKIADDGEYQIVVSMARSSGEVREHEDLMMYLNETNEFRNKAYGFPLELSYQGLKIDATSHDKDTLYVDVKERVLTFPVTAETDSLRFALKIKPGWNGVRIFCRENIGKVERRRGGVKTTRSAGGTWSARTVGVTSNPPTQNEKGTRIMRLGEIRAYVELNPINIEDKTNRTYDLLYNHREEFDSRNWNHTQGIIEDINNLNTVNGSTGDLYMTKGSGGQTWKNVMDTYKDFFDAQGMAYPDFSLINNPFDDEDVVPANGRKRVKKNYDGQTRQRSYTMLHEVFALPGERVDLYPYSDIWQPQGFNYEEQFVRWYDYLTDKAPDYLYFFAEPKSVIKTENAGFIGGKTLLDHGLRGKGTVASIYYRESERQAYADSVKNNLNPKGDKFYIDDVYKDASGQNMIRTVDNWVAADFSLAFNTNLQKRLGRMDDQDGKTIQEPIINFRHIFHITSGSLFADRYMWTADGNRHYTKSNRRYISSFSGKTFKIRLEQPMPVDEKTKSAYYYKTQTGDYRRVRGYEIRTYKLGVDGKSDAVGDAVTLSGDGISNGTAEEIEGMFELDRSSIFKQVDSYVETTTDESRWLDNSVEFARAIVCQAGNADEGRYLVRLYGKNSDGKIIGLKNGDVYDKPLVIAEYEVEFMDNKRASFVPENEIPAIEENSTHDYYTHMESYLERTYGATTNVKAVNFDQYMILNSESVVVEKGSAPVNFKRFGFFENVGEKSFSTGATWSNDLVNHYTLKDEISRMKMPITWGNSNYGFGYQITGDYNMFRLASHSLMTPYMEAASLRGSTKDASGNAIGETLTWTDDDGVEQEKTGIYGTYDRLFYNTHGEQKGLFYYVNAAADPGEMVKIDFDYLCPGSTIYVSAWVNEFNQNQPETANVIFNFYANVAKGEGEDKVMLRQEQIHGFVTGYVKKNPDGNYEDNSVKTGGDQGKWMHVYYSFVPDESHADVLKEEGEYIDSYYLVLENNCLSSEGADYAIDDIRAYVVAPRVEARQTNALCEKDDVNIDIRVELPLQALEQSLVGQADEDGIVRLQYSLVDKTIYDDVLEAKAQSYKDEQRDVEDPKEYAFTTDDYYEAFAKGVLHYRHDNSLSEDGNGVDKPLSWGVIEFYMDYNDDRYKEDGEYKDVYITDKDGNRLKINGQEWKIKDYVEKYIIDVYEKCFVFTTHPVSEDEDGNEEYNEFIKTHRDYYIVVDNIGTKEVFSALFYEYDEKGEIMKDIEGNPIFTDEFKDKDPLNKLNSEIYPENKDEKGEYVKSYKWEAYDKELAKAYQVGTSCARMDDFSLKGSAQIVIDGVLHETDDNITCCENQRPVVQINLKTKEKGKENPDLDVKDDAAESENPYLDWWAGPFEEFAEQTSDIVRKGETLSLWDILDDFRTDYPHVDTWNVPTVEEKKEGETTPEKYSNAMRNYLKGLCATTAINKDGETVPLEPKLILHQSSFVFPQSATKLVDENGKKVYSKDIYVTAIPPATPTEITGDDGKTYVICTQPREVKITVSNTSPTLFNGFNEIKYPEEIEDVPLRIGLKQLEKFAEGGTNNLFVPLRNVKKATYDVTEFLPFSEDKENKTTCEIYLVETNDPNYRKLSDHDKLDEKAPSDTYDVETRVVGKVTDLKVKFKTKTVGLDGSSETEVTSELDGTPMAQVVFDPWTEGTNEKGKKLDKGITFHEGYYYKFKFNFKEGETKLSGQEGYEMPCNGQTVFSIKVVPEYQIWTGDSSLNYNNDDNWRRVNKEHLLASSDVPYGQGTDSRYTVNSTYDNTHSYAPLNFTKVIIPAGATYPQLAARRHSYDSEGAHQGADSKQIENGKKSETFVWTGNSPKAVTEAGANKESSIWNISPASSYAPTVYINYDMAATTYPQDENVYCRPWYANACEQIHFNSNAEILNQQNLDYEKAWVDMEMAPHRWYTVASPLYGVVAGDMYLPSVGTDTPGRQMTELFTPITYNNTDKTQNDRFAPAVYQRGWDKGTEKVRILHDTDTTKTESVALASTWSHVYNDVTEEYAPGIGYSVKTDVTRLPKFADSYSQADKQTYVKFRFPKADTSYNYFSDSTQNVGELNHRTLTRTNEGKLYNFEVPKDNNGNVIADKSAGDVILKKATSGNLFLVGNPFMAHLDMKKFFEKNPTLPKKFWIMSESQQLTGVIDEEGNMILNGAVSQNGDKYKEEGKDYDYSLLAPMQGFFVQTAGDPTTSLDIKFTPDMMAVQPYADPDKKPILKAPAYGTRGDGDDIIRVSTPESTAIIRLSGSAEKGYAASEDVEMIDDSNQRGIRRIYTVAGTMASAINQTPDADGVEVGLMAPSDSLTVVTFNGLALEDYLLYDTATGEMTQLYDGFELEMTGSVSGRYFLTAGIDTAEIEDSTIRIMPVGHEVVVTAPAVCGELTVRVFDTLGREVAKAEGFEQEVRIGLEPGVYVVEAIGSDAGRKSAKLQIR